MLTRLQAINEILSSVGEQVVLEQVEGATDTVNAEAVLDAETRKVLFKGWHFNTDSGVTWAPDVDGKIPVPPEVLKVDPTDSRDDYVQRGSFLYDRTNHTDVIGKSVKVDVTVNLPFEDVPYAVQRVIVAQAASKYQRSYVGSAQLDAFQQEERFEAGADAADAEVDVDDYNILANPDLAYLRRQRYYGGL